MTSPTDPRPHRRPRGAVGFLAALALLGMVLAGALGGGAVDGAAPAPDPAAASPGATPTAPSTPARVPGGAEVPRVAATPPPVAGPSPTAPVRVTIPAQEIEVPVDPVGVADDGQMAIPPLAERGGWYRFGADPGDAAGTTVVAAHVDSVASGGTGPFVRLGDVRPGDRVEVALADGSVRAYAVERVERFPKSQARWPDVFTRDGAPRLALVTCGGAFDRATGHYTDNVLVIAAPVGA